MTINPDKILEHADRLIALLDAQIENAEKLIDMQQEMRRMIQLAKLEPRVVEGRYSFRAINTGSETWPRLRNYSLIIRYGIENGSAAGETKIPLSDAPRDLWPHEILQAVRRAEMREERLKERRG